MYLICFEVVEIVSAKVPGIETKRHHQKVAGDIILAAVSCKLQHTENPLFRAPDKVRVTLSKYQGANCLGSVVSRVFL
jgi:hypothetical protein